MRKNIQQLIHETEGQPAVSQSEKEDFKLLSKETAEQIRGGDQEYKPIIYESQTKRGGLIATVFLEILK